MCHREWDETIAPNQQILIPQLVVRRSFHTWSSSEPLQLLSATSYLLRRSDIKICVFFLLQALHVVHLLWKRLKGLFGHVQVFESCYFQTSFSSHSPTLSLCVPEKLQSSLTNRSERFPEISMRRRCLLKRNVGLKGFSSSDRRAAEFCPL